MQDRNGQMIEVGDTVRLIPGMPVGRVRKARIKSIDGDDIHVEANLGCCGGIVLAHRYPNEMELSPA
jgi:hypothetical protein